MAPREVLKIHFPEIATVFWRVQAEKSECPFVSASSHEFLSDMFQKFFFERVRRTSVSTICRG